MVVSSDSSFTWRTTKDHIILVGTKLDKADDDDPISFVHGVNGYDSVKSTFFEAGIFLGLLSISKVLAE